MEGSFSLVTFLSESRPRIFSGSSNPGACCDFPVDDPFALHKLGRLPFQKKLPPGISMRSSCLLACLTSSSWKDPPSLPTFFYLLALCSIPFPHSTLDLPRSLVGGPVFLSKTNSSLGAFFKCPRPSFSRSSAFPLSDGQFMRVLFSSSPLQSFETQTFLHLSLRISLPPFWSGIGFLSSSFVRPRF